MLNTKKVKPRNFVHNAMVRLGRKSVAHGKTKKADRRAFKANLMREVCDALA